MALFQQVHRYERYTRTFAPILACASIYGVVFSLDKRCSECSTLKMPSAASRSLKLRPEDVLAQPDVQEAQARGIITIAGDRVSYNLNNKKNYSWTDPEEWSRCRVVAFLIVGKD